MEPESSHKSWTAELAMEEHDHHVAQAAFLLWVEGFSFDWTQMTESQQDLYHGMVGRYLQSMNDVD